MSDTRLKQAENYIRGRKALHDHYNMQEVKACVQRSAGVKITQQEAIQIVEKVRNDKGWGAIEDYHIVSGDSDVESVFCLRCRITHDGGQC